jgi:hypothetical protein
MLAFEPLRWVLVVSFGVANPGATNDVERCWDNLWGFHHAVRSWDVNSRVPGFDQAQLNVCCCDLWAQQCSCIWNISSRLKLN